MTVEVILNKIEYLRIHNVSIHIDFYQNRFINECVRNNFLKFLERQMTFCDLQWTLRSYLLKIKYLRIHNISIQQKFYQNRFINECVRKNFHKFSYRRKDIKSERRKDVKTERRSSFVRCRRTFLKR